MGEVVSPALARMQALGFLKHPAVHALAARPAGRLRDPQEKYTLEKYSARQNAALAHIARKASVTGNAITESAPPGTAATEASAAKYLAPEYSSSEVSAQHRTAQQQVAYADARCYQGSLREIAELVPAFDRRPLAEEGGRAQSAHPHLDVLVRRAGPGVGLLDMPVGVVTRRHQLLPHGRILHSIDRALGLLRVDPAQTATTLQLTDFGAHMALAVDLPQRYDLDPGDGQALGLRLLCTNAVNGGGLRLLMTWHRRVSDSAIAVGTSRLEYRLAHRLPARLSDIVPSVHKAVESAQSERAALANWCAKLVSRDALAAWADGPVRRMWGRRMAARVFHICMTGWDAEPAFSVERSVPTRRTMQASDPVPGAPDFVETAYDALLALAWISRDARDGQVHADRLVEGAVLMRALLRGSAQ